MPTDKMEVGNLFIVDPNTGDKIELVGIQEITFEPLEPIDTKFLSLPPEYNFSIDMFRISAKALRDILYKTFTVTGTVEEIARQVFLNIPLGREVVDLDFKQNKTHKKKRINKKWARKYGYTCKVYYVEGD